MIEPLLFHEVPRPFEAEFALRNRKVLRKHVGRPDGLAELDPGFCSVVEEISDVLCCDEDDVLAELLLDSAIFGVEVFDGFRERGRVPLARGRGRKFVGGEIAQGGELVLISGQLELLQASTRDHTFFAIPRTSKCHIRASR